MAKKMPEPEAKLDFVKVIPRDDLQAKFKEVAKLKSDLIKERNTLMTNRNKEVDVIVQKALKLAKLENEYAEIINESNTKLGGITQRIAECEGSMKVLIEFINRKKGTTKK